MAETTSHHLKGVLLGSCSCDWGCPCNFEAPPTRGFCEGGYIWHLQQGVYGQVTLDGLSVALYARAPGPVHLGDLTTLYLVDERATPHQREAIEEMVTGNPVVPFSIFAALTSHSLGIRHVPFVLDLQGTQSRAKIGNAVELQLMPMANPVTGEEEPATLNKPRGFTSQQQELCATSTFRLTTDALSYDHSGKYGEFCHFEYRG
jgi:hypothetical protein